MGNTATPEALIRRWTELCHDSSLRDLPYKIELNRWGKLEMTPLTNRRGRLASHLASELGEKMSGGIPLFSCGVLTRNGVHVADVAWASDELMTVSVHAMLFERAPEICVEVCTPDGEEKVAGYLDAGAKEVWLVSNAGSLRYFDASGELETTGFPLTVRLPAPMEMQ